MSGSNTPCHVANPDLETPEAQAKKETRVVEAAKHQESVLNIHHLASMLLCTSVLLSACGNVEDAKKQEITAPVSAEPVQVTVLPVEPVVELAPLTYAHHSLSNVFVGYDIKSLATKAKELGVLEKKEFEKTEDFKLRKADFISSYLNLNGKPTLGFFVPTTSYVTYDADAEKFNIKLQVDGNYTNSHYDRSKAFPNAIIVEFETDYSQERLGLKIHDGISYRVGFKVKESDSSFINFPLNVPIEKAQLLKDSLSVAVVGSIVDPIIMHWQTWTIEYDKIDQITDWTLSLYGVQFWLYDKSTLEVLAKFDHNLKIIKTQDK